MITFVEGELVEKQPARVVLNVGGVGYEVAIPLSSYNRLPDTGASCRLLTHFYVREDAHKLFGFMTDTEREMFEMLLTVSGVGPRIALSALSGLSVREIKRAVIEGDVKRLSSISGVGKKMAERMVVDLRHKWSAGESLEATAGAAHIETGDTRLRDAILALISLGYKQADAQKMIRTMAAQIGKEESVEDIVRKSLTQ